MMSPQELVTVEIQITAEQRDQIEQLARQQGYTALSDYLRALISANAQTLLEEDSDETVLEGFREGWRDAMTDNTFPASSLWDDDLDDT